MNLILLVISMRQSLKFVFIFSIVYQNHRIIRSDSQTKNISYKPVRQVLRKVIR